MVALRPSTALPAAGSSSTRRRASPLPAAAQTSRLAALSLLALAALPSAAAGPSLFLFDTSTVPGLAPQGAETSLVVVAGRLRRPWSTDAPPVSLLLLLLLCSPPLPQSLLPPFRSTLFPVARCRPCVLSSLAYAARRCILLAPLATPHFIRPPALPARPPLSRAPAAVHRSAPPLRPTRLLAYHSTEHSQPRKRYPISTSAADLDGKTFDFVVAGCVFPFLFLLSRRAKNGERGRFRARRASLPRIRRRDSLPPAAAPVTPPTLLTSYPPSFSENNTFADPSCPLSY